MPFFIKLALKPIINNGLKSFSSEKFSNDWYFIKQQEECSTIIKENLQSHIKYFFWWNYHKLCCLYPQFQYLLHQH
jgi:hypothetical protein